ncbi:MAG: ATP-grasp domain-containing protein [Bacteroidota bacterium]
MEKGTVLVTGIGGNVGQGIIRNIISCNWPIKIIGTNITDFSAGNYLIDKFYKVSYGYSEDYITQIKQIVELEHVDLIIPSTDFESYYLSLNSDNIKCKIAVSGKASTEIYLDKYLTWKFHNRFSIPFAESILPSVYNNNFDLAIAKPRKGRGSKGIIKNISKDEDIKKLKDDEYMIQKMYEGKEITTAVYVRHNDKKIHGLISMERSLENGATTYCKVITDYDIQMQEIAEKMAESIDLVGSFNIQSIVNDRGEIYPFEVNCRISGTNSIRANFGFHDVKYTLQELLFNKFPDEINITKGFAYRFLSDVIYLENGTNINGDNKDNFIVF